MSIWLSQGFEGVPEQDNKIACQVLWSEDSRHLWTGVWANKPGVFQDLLFLKLSSPHLSLWDLLNNFEPRGARGEGPPASAQVPGHCLATVPDGAKHFSVVQRAAGGTHSCQANSMLTSRPGSEKMLSQGLGAYAPPKACTVGIWGLALAFLSTWTVTKSWDSVFLSANV